MTDDRHPILTARIPAGGFGRALTDKERRNLKRLDIAVPVRSRVVRAFDSDYIGALYNPKKGGMASLGISVTLTPDA